VTDHLAVPETKGLSLEEMDIIFGSIGIAQADAERMREINREVGLDDMVKYGSVSAQGGQDPSFLNEKKSAQHAEESE